MKKWISTKTEPLTKENEALFQFRRTKIVSTLGPATNTEEKIGELVDAGVNVFRLNFSHGDHEYHGKVIDNIHKVMATKRKTYCAVMLDTKGPEIRTGLNAEGKDISVKKGQQLILTTDDEFNGKGNNEKIYVDYKNITKVLSIGKRVLIDDGLVGCEVVSIGDDHLVTKVLNDGELGSRKGVNLPGIKVDLPAVTERDRKDLLFGRDNNVDFVAASFIRKPEDVNEIRKVLGRRGAHIKIISKIENAEGIHNFDAILEVSDGIMVARGDMGVEIPLEKVALAQKMMIAKCNVAGKPVITATQMLESMVHNPRPTRAEANDVANAVMDGSDAVMLSGETAKGAYPIKAVKTMAKICVSAESSLEYNEMYNNIRSSTLSAEGMRSLSITETIASSAVKVTMEVDAKFLLTITETGNTAMLCSKYRPAPPIFAITQVDRTARQLALVWGVRPVLVETVIGTDGVIRREIMIQMNEGRLKENDCYVVTCGNKEGVSGHTNMLKISYANQIN